jgi:MFS transporter, MHS family, proline/betaine transporter
MAFVLTASLTDEQLHAWGWRVPFWSGILVSLSGFYLRAHAAGEEHDDDAPYSQRGQSCPTTTVPETTPEPTQESDNDNHHNVDHDDNIRSCNNIAAAAAAASEERAKKKKINPLRIAFSRGNRRALAAATMVPMLWSAGFYLSFVWMATYMEHMLEPPIPHAFLVNATALLLSVCMFFPVAGTLSDRHGRKRVMMLGGVSLGILSPLMLRLIGIGNSFLALLAQIILGIALSLWGAPMCAWLVESFEPQARLTSVAIGYNVAHATVGGMSPALATLLVDKVSLQAPGWILTALAIISVSGLWFVAPPAPARLTPIAAATTAPAMASDTRQQPGERSRAAASFSALTTMDTSDDFELVENTDDIVLSSDEDNDDDDHELI